MSLIYKLSHPHIINVLFILGRAPGYDSFVEGEGPKRGKFSQEGHFWCKVGCLIYEGNISSAVRISSDLRMLHEKGGLMSLSPFY